MIPLDRPGHGPDGHWWWDGYQWLPAVSPDGSLWFDGRRWITRKPRRSGTSIATLAVTGAVWAGALSAAPGFIFDAARRANWVTLPSADYPGAIGLGALGLVSTVVVGVILGRRASWAALPIAGVAGTVVVAGWYIAMMDASYPATDPTVDNATGVGLVILGVPALAVLCLLLAAGMVVGRLIGRCPGAAP